MGTFFSTFAKKDDIDYFVIRSVSPPFWVILSAGFCENGRYRSDGE
jgi:hypothetical protein